MRDTNAVATKIADHGLRRFVEQHARGRRSVLIEVDAPPRVIVRKGGGQMEPRAVIRPSSKGAVVDQEAIDRLTQWLENMGVKSRYLGASQAFVATATAEQLARIVRSTAIRSVAANRRVRAL